MRVRTPLSCLTLILTHKPTTSSHSYQHTSPLLPHTYTNTQAHYLLTLIPTHKPTTSSHLYQHTSPLPPHTYTNTQAHYLLTLIPTHKPTTSSHLYQHTSPLPPHTYTNTQAHYLLTLISTHVYQHTSPLPPHTNIPTHKPTTSSLVYQHTSPLPPHTYTNTLIPTHKPTTSSHLYQHTSPLLGLCGLCLFSSLLCYVPILFIMLSVFPIILCGFTHYAYFIPTFFVFFRCFVDFFTLTNEIRVIHKSISTFFRLVYIQELMQLSLRKDASSKAIV